jgi:hypothetical protein
MEELRLGDQLVRFNREATAAAYRELPFGGADRCKCVYCRNFAAQRATVFPQGFRAFLDQLGVDPDKEGEVYDMGGTDGSRIRLTGGWFYFVGELIEKGESLIPAGDFQYRFQPSFPQPPASFGKQVAAIEFFTQVPWVLDEHPAG